MIAALWIWVAPAMAWEWITTRTGGCTGVSWPASSIPYVMFGVDPHFTTAERDAIEAGIAVWTAGPGTVNRGAEFEYWINGTQTGQQSITNTTNEIWHIEKDDGINIYGMSNGWLGFGPAVGDAICLAIANADIVLNRDASWSTNLPSLAGSGGWSLEAAVAHEAGHDMGLGHELDHLSLMYRHPVGEQGGAVRLPEDEYSFLRSRFPHSSTGKNFMLSKWLVGSGVRVVTEGWTTNEASDWESDDPCGTIPVEDGPKPIWASVNGTAASYTVPIEWTLSADTTCFDADAIVIGSRTPVMSSNVPYEVEPAGGAYVIPSSTPDGAYWVCAGINPDQAISEAQNAFDDNTVRSEGTWTIDCP